MLVSQETREVTTHGVVESNTFSIKANGKAFKVLIDGLYSNKILAVIRELWSNAHDSHAEAGCPERPFDCQLPTIWEPQFRVRDYGVSLSHDGVMRLYTTVFESTKEDTNAQVGKLGLGSKSPFAYTDTFTVTAWKDGEKRIYSAYIGEDYVPRISLLGTEVSDEPQGLEVAFPAQTSDCRKFIEAAERVIRGFTVKPNIIGEGVQLRETERNVLVSGDGWKLYESEDWSEGAVARQGCVIYPIDPEAVNGATPTQRGLLNAPFFIDFPIGALEIAASREGLGYDKTTCANIVAKLAEIERDVIAHFSKEIADIPTRWAVAKRFNTLKQFNLPEAVIKCLEHMTWRGRKLQTKFHVRNRSGSGFTAHKVAQNVVLGGRSRHGDGWTGNATGYWVTPSDHVTIYYNDPALGLNHVRERIKHHYTGHIHRGDIVVVRAARGSMFLKRFLVQCGRPDMINVADLAVPPKDKLPQRRKTMIKLMTRGGWEDTEVDLTQGGIYVAMDRDDIIGPQGTVSAGRDTVRSIADALIELGVDCKRIYGIPRSRKSVEKLPGWRTIWDVAREAMQNYSAHDHGYYQAISAAIDGVCSEGGSLVEQWVKAETRPAEGVAAQIYDRFQALLTTFTALETPLFRIANVWPVENAYSPTPQKLDLQPEVSLLLHTYPLVNHYGRRSLIDENSARILLDYVNLADDHRRLSNIRHAA